MVPVDSDDGPLVAEVYMGFQPSTATVRTTVVQAAAVFYGTPATSEFWLFVVIDMYSVVVQLF